jgi:uncharacterized membrane protein
MAAHLKTLRRDIMAFCGKCGSEIKDGAQFCPSCGASVAGKPVKQAAQVGEVQADASDAEQGKVMSVISYIGILCLIPIITGDYKKSPFVKFHTNQGLVLCIADVAWWFVSFILGLILGRLWILSILWSLVGFAVWVGVIVLIVLGIINAVNGRMKPLPVIGKFEILK